MPDVTVRKRAFHAEDYASGRRKLDPLGFEERNVEEAGGAQRRQDGADQHAERGYGEQEQGGQ
jgi:hypothetical protein